MVVLILNFKFLADSATIQGLNDKLSTKGKNGLFQVIVMVVLILNLKFSADSTAVSKSINGLQTQLNTTKGKSVGARVQCNITY